VSREQAPPFHRAFDCEVRSGRQRRDSHLVVTGVNFQIRLCDVTYSNRCARRTRPARGRHEREDPKKSSSDPWRYNLPFSHSIVVVVVVFSNRTFIVLLCNRSISVDTFRLRFRTAQSHDIES
jgi:hypothetical protein